VSLLEGIKSAVGSVFWSNYTDMPNSPLYPFGYSLSYTWFEFSEPSLSSDEIAQLYVRDMVGSVTRPVRELKGFQRAKQSPGRLKCLWVEAQQIRALPGSGSDNRNNL
jgi:hypothetical protein